MKKDVFVLSICFAVVAVIAASCSKDDDSNGGIPDYLVGTWALYGYYIGDDTHTLWIAYEEDGFPETTVTLKSNGKCSGKGMLINGDGDFTVKTGNKWNDGYWAIIQFSQGGKKISTATLESYDNDRLTGYVDIEGYADKTFVFKKQ